MQKMKFKVYIGEVYESIREGFPYLIDLIEPFIPRGDLNKTSISYFSIFQNLSTYFADWFDILKKFNIDLNCVSTTVVLGSKSNTRIFIGESIIKCLDSISKLTDKEILKLRNFPEL